MVTGLLSKSGLFDTSVGLKTIQGIFDERGGKMHRKYAASCVDSNTGDYIVFNETTSNPAKAVISSSSIPFAFPHQIWDDIDGRKVVCMDGGSVWNTNLVSAIQRCREDVDDDSEIVLDILLCSGSSLDKWDESGKALSNYFREQNIKDYNSGMNDINEFL